MDTRALIISVSEDEKLMVDSLCSMLRVPAIGPENDGKGEGERGEYLVELAKKLGMESIEIHNSVDRRVPTGKRPNLIIRAKGSSDKNLWVVAHMDTVPEGDLAAWTHPPFEARVVEGRIYGRGSEDNGQELIASLFGLRALIKNGITPECNIGLVFVSDEEHGNIHGIDFLIAKGIFKMGDLVVVPDHGDPDGSSICVVEKGIAWVNVEVVGKQTHGSTPEHGINAFEVASRYMIAVLDELRKRFLKADPLFEPPTSTFSPTKCDANVPNVNTIPGRQHFAFDFRVLPDFKLDDVMAVLERLAREFERSTGAKINLTFLQKTDAAPQTPLDADVVKRLADAIEVVKGVKPHPIGIGGGTCAAPFRRLGIAAAVWSTIQNLAHDADEYSNVKDLVSDAQVYAVLFAGKNVKRV